jgi:hypothetical protein
MSIAIYETTVQDAQGRALSGATVYFCTQPANTTVFPPSPLATIFSNTTGTVLAQPVITNGFGLAVAYLTTGTLYTVVVNHPLFATPLVYTDQQVGGGTGNSVTPVNASTLAGTITGSIPGSSFTLPSTPTAGSLVLDQNGVTLTPNLGYSLSGATITLATALAAGEGLNANYLLVS